MRKSRSVEARAAGSDDSDILSPVLRMCALCKSLVVISGGSQKRGRITVITVVAVGLFDLRWSAPRARRQGNPCGCAGMSDGQSRMPVRSHLSCAHRHAINRQIVDDGGDTGPQLDEPRPGVEEPLLDAGHGAARRRDAFSNA
jgi:hypothetical protein